MIKKIHRNEEQQIKLSILSYFWHKKIDAFPIKSMGTYDAKRKKFLSNKNPLVQKGNGVSDICVVTTFHKIPVTIWLEVKTNRNKQTPSQIEFENMIVRSSGYYFVVRSIDDAVRALELVRQNCYQLLC